MKTKRLLPVLILSLLGNCAQAIDLSGSLFEKAGLQQDVDPLLIYAVALTESAFSPTIDQPTPWAWTLNVNSKGIYAKNRQDATRTLEALLQQHESIDVGMMQINIKWHGHQVSSPLELLDPHVNIAVGTRILKVAIDSAPNDLELGIGRYHQWADKRMARRYGARVLRTYKRLQLAQQQQVDTDPQLLDESLKTQLISLLRPIRDHYLLHAGQASQSNTPVAAL